LITESRKSSGFQCRHKTVRERREKLWIANLRRLPCFEQLVKKVVEGQSVTSVTKWLHGLGVAGETRSYHTLGQYVTALSIRVKRNVAQVERKDVTPLAFKMVMQEFEAQDDSVLDDDPEMSQKNVTRIWKVVSDAVRKLESETMLKYCFMVQLARVTRIEELEERTGLPYPGMDKAVRVLKEIAAEVRKVEVGEQYLKGKLSLPNPELPHAVPSPEADDLTRRTCEL